MELMKSDSSEGSPWLGARGKGANETQKEGLEIAEVVVEVLAQLFPNFFVKKMWGVGGGKAYHLKDDHTSTRDSIWARRSTSTQLRWLAPLRWRH